MDRFDKTVTVQTPPELRRFTQASVLPSILDKMGKDAVNSIQFLPGGSFRASCCAMDIWRDLHPLTPGFTWESPDHALASRIVLIGCPAVCAPFVSFCNFVPCPFSDHSVVHLSISPPVLIPRGPGRWKCNISILEDPELRSEIESFWIYWRTRQPFFPSVREWSLIRGPFPSFYRRPYSSSPGFKYYL